MPIGEPKGAGSSDPRDINPETPFDVERDITGEDWEGMKKELENSSIQDYLGGFCSQAMQMKILDPSQDLHLDGHRVSHMEKELHENRYRRGLAGFFL